MMEPVSATLFSLYRDTPQHSEWVVACLDGAWQGLLGEKIGTACRPRDLRREELVIEVFEEAWLPVLSDMKTELLSRIRSTTSGEIRRLSFVLRRGASGLRFRS
jgi:hypothetical protein